MTLNLVTRQQWGALAPRKTIPIKSSDLKGIVVHHTVTNSAGSNGDLTAAVKNIQNYHRNTRGWYDVAYNYLISLDGRVWEGRGLGVRQGATNHVNGDYYAVAFIGHFGGACDCSPPAPPEAKKDLLTPQAILAFQDLRQMLLRDGIGVDVAVHRDFKATACPGDNIDNRAMMDALRSFPPPPPVKKIDPSVEDWRKVLEIAQRNIQRLQ